MADPILGGVLGGVARLAPEILGFFNRRGERKHELKLGEQQLELIKAQSHTRLEETAAQSEADQSATALQALRDSIQSQAKQTGIKWVDAISASVRPVWTYLVLLSWATVHYVNVGVAIAQSASWREIQHVLWTSDDAAMLSTLATFWFLDRVIRKAPVR